MGELLIASAERGFVVVDQSGRLVHELAHGDCLALWIGGIWQTAYVGSGGYKGWYYITEQGEWGRFALGMRVQVSQLERVEQVRQEMVEQVAQEIACLCAWMTDEDLRRLRHFLAARMGLHEGEVTVLLEESFALWLRASVEGDQRRAWTFLQEYRCVCAFQCGEEYQYPEMPAWIAQLP